MCKSIAHGREETPNAKGAKLMDRIYRMNRIVRGRFLTQRRGGAELFESWHGGGEGFATKNTKRS